MEGGKGAAGMRGERQGRGTSEQGMDGQEGEKRNRGEKTDTERGAGGEEHGKCLRRWEEGDISDVLLDINAHNQLRGREPYCPFTMSTCRFRAFRTLPCLWHNQYRSVPKGLRGSWTGCETSWAQ